MAYTNPQNVRDLLGLDIETATDEILLEFIDDAMEYIRTYIQISVIDESLNGNINGINNTFTTYYTYFADITGNTIITTADFKVYGWAKNFEDDPFKKVELTVSTFDPIRGVIVLASAPSSSTYGKITVNYSYYTKAINWKLLGQITAWKAAEIWVKREEYLVPESYSFAGRRVTQRRPWKFYEYEVNRLRDKITALPMSRVEYAKLVFRPRKSGSKPEVDTTASKDINQSGTNYKPDLT